MSEIVFRVNWGNHESAANIQVRCLPVFLLAGGEESEPLPSLSSGRRVTCAVRTWEGVGVLCTWRRVASMAVTSAPGRGGSPVASVSLPPPSAAEGGHSSLKPVPQVRPREEMSGSSPPLLSSSQSRLVTRVLGGPRVTHQSEWTGAGMQGDARGLASGPQYHEVPGGGRVS